MQDLTSQFKRGTFQVRTYVSWRVLKLVEKISNSSKKNLFIFRNLTHS